MNNNSFINGDRSNKNEGNNKSNNRKVNVSIIISILVGLILTVICIGELVFIMYICKMVLENNEAISFSSIAEGSLLATGLAIIGVAVSVWAGLNIANSIERKEIEEIRENVKKNDEIIKKYNDMMKNNLALLNIKTDEAYTNDKETFLQELLATDTDITNRFFYEAFMREDSKKINYSELIYIERIFKQVLELHKNNEKDRRIIEITDAALTRISEMYKRDKDKYKYLSIPIVKLFIIYRKADLKFYKGYAESKSNVYQLYISSATTYENYSDSFGAIIPDFISGFDLNYKAYPINDSKYNIDMSIYFLNAIGEAYSKIADNKKHIINVIANNRKTISEEDVLACAEKAIFYCGYAVNWMEKVEGACKREVYYRNLGCAYERLDKVKDEDIVGNHAKEIFDNYKKALFTVITTDKINTKGYNAYYALLSYFEKYFRYITQYNNNSSKTIEDSFKRLGDITFDSNSLEYLKEYGKISSIAFDNKKYIPLYHKYIGFYNSWIVALILSGNRQIINEFSDGTADYINRIEDVVYYLNTIESENKDPYTKDLINRLKIIHKMNTAGSEKKAI